MRGCAGAAANDAGPAERRWSGGGWHDPALSPALAHEAECSSGVIDGLVASGNLVEVAIPDKRLAAARSATTRRTEFVAASRPQAVHALRSAVDGGNFSVSLLDGVTGSGKTEVYFEAVARSARGRAAGGDHAAGNRADALSSCDRFEERFGCQPVEWHSALSAPERGRVWKAAATGEARVVVGARSALFLPFSDLGLIIVDEEHDAGFKQDDRVHYQARDMAVVRGNLGKFPGRAGVGDAVDRKPCQCAAPAAIAMSYCRDASPAPSCPTSRRSICASAAGQGAAGCRRCSSMPSPKRWPASSSRCCSSTGAVMRR